MVKLVELGKTGIGILPEGGEKSGGCRKHENRKKDKSTNAVLSILRTMNRALNAVDAEKTWRKSEAGADMVELGVFIGLNSSISSFNRQVKKQKPSAKNS